MRSISIVKGNLVKGVVALLACPAMFGAAALAQDATPTAGGPAAPSARNMTYAPLPPPPPPMNLPHPGPTNDAPYQPQPIVAGGVVIPLFPPDSHYLNTNRIREAEVYSLSRATPGRISSIVNIHNPSIEVHTVEANLNTGATVILAAGGGHNTLNVGGESADFVPFFFNYGVNTVILRNRLRTSGYNPKTDEMYDALQAVKLVRAHAKDWHLDPNKIGIMGFSAGAELAAAAAVQFADFDKANDLLDNPLGGTSSRPDFVGIVYPGPSPFAPARGGSATPQPPPPRNTPPAFLTCAGWGDPQHAAWADQYFAAMLAAGIPNVEMHIYARGHHPGDRVGPDEPPASGGLTDRGFIAYGTWQYRFIDWFKDLGFLQKQEGDGHWPVTLAARDSENFVKQPPRGAGGRGGSGGSRAAAPGTDAAGTNNPAAAGMPPPAAAPRGQ